MIVETSGKVGMITTSIDESVKFLDELNNGIKAQEKASFAINQDVENISEIANNIFELINFEKKTLLEFQSRNEQKVELTSAATLIASHLEDVNSKLQTISENLTSLFKKT